MPEAHWRVSTVRRRHGGGRVEQDGVLTSTVGTAGAAPEKQRGWRDGCASVPDWQVGSRSYSRAEPGRSGGLVLRASGFRARRAFRVLAEGFEGGPLQISADGGATTLALFEASDGHPMVPQVTGVAFSVDADTFLLFARSLPSEINGPDGRALAADDVVDFDMCWAFNLADPWGNQYELNCYDYDRVRNELIMEDGIRAVRFWPADLHRSWLGTATQG